MNIPQDVYIHCIFPYLTIDDLYNLSQCDKFLRILIAKYYSDINNLISTSSGREILACTHIFQAVCRSFTRSNVWNFIPVYRRLTQSVYKYLAAKIMATEHSQDSQDKDLLKVFKEKILPLLTTDLSEQVLYNKFVYVVMTQRDLWGASERYVCSYGKQENLFFQINHQNNTTTVTAYHHDTDDCVEAYEDLHLYYLTGFYCEYEDKYKELAKVEINPDHRVITFWQDMTYIHIEVKKNKPWQLFFATSGYHKDYPWNISRSRVGGYERVQEFHERLHQQALLSEDFKEVFATNMPKLKNNKWMHIYYLSNHTSGSKFRNMIYDVAYVNEKSVIKWYKFTYKVLEYCCPRGAKFIEQFLV